MTFNTCLENVVAEALFRVEEVNTPITVDFPVLAEAQKYITVLQSLRANFKYTFRKFSFFGSTPRI